jgi:putative proteasome-type protease
MTYCVATRLNAGIVFLSDSRTNAGVDHIGTFRKMNVFENSGERVIVMMSSGNLAITQAVRQTLSRPPEKDEDTIWTAKTMFDVAGLVGKAIRQVYERDAKTLKEFGVDFNCNLIIGGQIQGDSCRLFHIYSAGNFIEATDENLYFQIGEAKYGKPIIDRVVHPNTSLDESAKCLLISMDSTLRSNLSVGLPLDLLCYQTDSLKVDKMIHIDGTNEYFQMIRKTWGSRLKQVFSELPNPEW